METQNRKYGKVTREKRCDARGKYKKGEGSVSLLWQYQATSKQVSLSHSTGASRRGGLICIDSSVTCQLCDWVDANRPGRSFLFMMDNLNLHMHPIVSNLINGRGHRVVFRASYWSCNGSIEYVFNTVQTRLQMDVHGVDNKINTIVGNMPSFKRYFIHVGFPDN